MDDPDDTTTRRQVQEQFGANAAAYVNSPTHARGASLPRLVERVAPRPDWRVLDVATAAGHTALVFAPHVAAVVGLDLTPQMLPLAVGLAAERGTTNVTFTVGDVAELPFGSAAFDAVTCRIAPHHFADVGRFIAEAARVLRPGGVLAVVDNVVPGSRLRGKKADQQRQAGAYVNAFEKLRDPSHVRCLSVEEWLDLLAAAGLAVAEPETLEKRLTFETWAARHTPEMQARLRAMLLRAPAAAAAFLDPQTHTGLTTFRLQEGLFIAHR
jgi:SAM-dependent methyltransferase